MTNKLRWYDKDKYLSAFMVLLQDLPAHVQAEVAVDMLLKIPELIDKDFEKFTTIVARHNPREFQRWYDANPNVHAAIDAMRELDKKQRETLINSISDIILKHTGQHFGPNEEE